MADGLPDEAKHFRINSNKLEENEEKEPIDIEFTEQKTAPDNNEIILTLNDRMYKRKTRKILLRLTSLRAYKSKLMMKFSQKVTRRLFDDCGIVPITVSNMETALLLGSLLLQVRSIICDPTWSKKDPSWRPVSIFESVIMKRKIKNIFFNVIYNTKIFSIKFCYMMLLATKILPNLQGIRQRRDCTASNTVQN